jgi:hypothetical protein
LGGITERTSETGVPPVDCVDAVEVVVLVVELEAAAANADGRASIDKRSNREAARVICNPPGRPFILSFSAAFQRI